jgi:hypothetical protein
MDGDRSIGGRLYRAQLFRQRRQVTEEAELLLSLQRLSLHSL